MHMLDMPAALASGSNPHGPAAQAALAAMESARAVAAKALVEAAGMELFGTFLLGEEEFALPASAIREVVAYPERVTPMPLSPCYLEGIFTLRGTAIPVVNLARIFHPDAPKAGAGQKIAILDHDDVLVGLVFDGTGEVLRVRPEQRSTVSYGDGHAAPVIGGTILLADGARLLQVLVPEALIRIENVPQVRSMSAASRAAERTRFLRHAEAKKCLCFTAGSTSFAFAMSAVQEIINVPALRTSVMMGPLCKGWINFRGRAVGVIDFGALMRCAPEEAADPADRRILIARIGDELLGFLVDGVDTINPYFDSDVLPIPLLGTQRGAMFRGCLPRTNGPDTLFLDHEKVLADAELKEVCAGHRRIYQDEAAAEAGRCASNAAAARRQVYLAFGLGSPWASDICQVREIIPYTGALTRTPGTPACVQGMLNLRQQMISVIDLRKLYDMPPLEDKSECRILVLERGAERYGVIVDSVQSIVNLPASARRPSPKLLRVGATEADMRSDVKEVLELPDATVLSLFDRDAFFAKLESVLSA
ncbi:purine-binding chemotaxis protein CheW [Pseudoduganella lurida]|uniref:Purine-binding chemotaxis protein CheW n=1 Tax=Pseudoduganella lurida TaxID=1036180 RepID=A0A562RE60_9BURK|nr:chemotaxis protein CheW [Pseudoduganella lurida]TWI67352.1 purine-binding chemotaxis protein CheW [Pseudoduganella lurida]